ncbi:TPA: ROK family protein [Candidatus Saccharibacteria bacterium]|nr:ROK family protein [Candidatus Saccharibacteria bacterium]HIO87184.1 ROK family protein [Candidatus Saccharibacteria bacterium]
MILGVDIGGTKTLFSLFPLQNDPQPVVQKKIATPETYAEFKNITAQIVSEFSPQPLTIASFAVPGPVSRDKKSVPILGNKDWKNIHLVEDFNKLLNCHVIINNDAKLGGLSEAISGAGVGHSVNLYVTLSTGIGAGVIVDKKIEPEMSRDEVGMMPFEKNGTTVVWEDLASARAFNQRYGGLATEIDDPTIWNEFSKDIALGLSHLISTIDTDLVILGGPVGSQFEKYQQYLLQHLDQYLSVKKQLKQVPAITKAAFPNQCVIRGCFYAAKQYLAAN